MSLTSRVNRLTTGPVPSVGSDDWPSRYIWRWIWRRSAVATSLAASAITARRDCATRQSASSSARPDGQQGRQAPRGCSGASGPGRSTPRARRGRRPVERVRAAEVARDEREQPGVVEDRTSPSRPSPRPARPSRAGAARSADRAAGPRPASTSSAGEQPRDHEQRQQDQERMDDPEDRGRERPRLRLGAQELTSAIDTRPHACVEVPSARGGRAGRGDGPRPGPPDAARARSARRLRPGRGPRTGGTRTGAPLHCTTCNSPSAGRTYPTQGITAPVEIAGPALKNSSVGQDPGEQLGHEADQLVDLPLARSPRPGPG